MGSIGPTLCCCGGPTSCGTCCSPALTLTSTVTLDFGAGGLTDPGGSKPCSGCTSLDGEFVLSAVSGTGICCFHYEPASPAPFQGGFSFPCSNDNNGQTCSGINVNDPDIGLFISAGMFEGTISGASRCAWNAAVGFYCGGVSPECGTNRFSGLGVCYGMLLTDPNVYNCQSTGPSWTLTKMSSATHLLFANNPFAGCWCQPSTFDEQWTSGGYGCSGSLPSTITLTLSP